MLTAFQPITVTALGPPVVVVKFGGLASNQGVFICLASGLLSLYTRCGVLGSSCLNDSCVYLVPYAGTVQF